MSFAFAAATARLSASMSAGSGACRPRCQTALIAIASKPELLASCIAASASPNRAESSTAPTTSLLDDPQPASTTARSSAAAILATDPGYPVAEALTVEYSSEVVLDAGNRPAVLGRLGQRAFRAFVVGELARVVVVVHEEREGCRLQHL